MTRRFACRSAGKYSCQDSRTWQSPLVQLHGPHGRRSSLALPAKRRGGCKVYERLLWPAACPLQSVHVAGEHALISVCSRRCEGSGGSPSPLYAWRARMFVLTRPCAASIREAQEPTIRVDSVQIPVHNLCGWIHTSHAFWNMAATNPVKPLGSQGLQVARLGFGCMSLSSNLYGGHVPVPEEQSTAVLRRAYDLGERQTLEAGPTLGVLHFHVRNTPNVCAQTQTTTQRALP